MTDRPSDRQACGRERGRGPPAPALGCGDSIHSDFLPRLGLQTLRGQASSPDPVSKPRDGRQTTHSEKDQSEKSARNHAHHNVTRGCFWVIIFWAIFFEFTYFERQRDGVGGRGERERERWREGRRKGGRAHMQKQGRSREKERHNPSSLCTIITEPDEGLELPHSRSQPEQRPRVGRPTDRAPQAPPCLGSLRAFCP